MVNAPRRATHAHASLRLIHGTLSASLVAPASITLPRLGRGLDPDGIAAEAGPSARIRAALAALRDAVEDGDRCDVRPKKPGVRSGARTLPARPTPALRSRPTDGT